MTLDKIDLVVDFEHCVYRLTFPNGKFYFGESMHILKRLYAHSKVAFRKNTKAYSYPLSKAIRHFGVSAIIVEIIMVGCKKSCIACEKEMIFKYGTVEQGRTYNVLLGNPSDGKKFTKKTRLKMAAAISAAWATNKRKNIINKNSGIPVWQYNLDGSFVQEWPNCSWAAKVLGGSTSKINLAVNKGGSSMGFIWIRAIGSRPKKGIKKTGGVGHLGAGEVTVRDKNTRKIIGTYCNAAYGARALGVNGGAVKTHINDPYWKPSAYGYIWTRGEDGYKKYLEIEKQKIEDKKIKKSFKNTAKHKFLSKKSGKKYSKKIWQYKLNGDFVQEWPSIASAAKYFKIGVKSFRNALREERFTSCGFYWMFAEPSRPKTYPLVKKHLKFLLPI